MSGPDSGEALLGLWALWRREVGQGTLFGGAEVDYEGGQLGEGGEVLVELMEFVAQQPRTAVAFKRTSSNTNQHALQRCACTTTV
jgi:hypothetical protein